MSINDQSFSGSCPTCGQEFHPLQRFLVFAADQYYPDGGWRDFRGSFATLEEAKKRAEELCGLPDGLPWPASGNWDWAHIVDSFHPEQEPLEWSKAHSMKKERSAK